MFSAINVLLIVIMMVISYLIGAINASIIVTKLMDSGSDIREVGSGNAGFTNVLRTKGKKLAICTFLIDFIKGVMAVGLSQFVMIYFCGFSVESLQFCVGSYISCLCCVLGHMYPCFFGFRGGKSILTTWAATLLIDWKIFVFLISVFIVVLIVTKIVSIASICAAMSFPIAAWITTCVVCNNMVLDIALVSIVLASLISVLVIYRHKNNIERILNGTEKRITIHK